MHVSEVAKDDKCLRLERILEITKWKIDDESR